MAPYCCIGHCYVHPMAFAGINGQQIFFDHTGGDGPPAVLANGLVSAEQHEVAVIQFVAALPA